MTPRTTNPEIPDRDIDRLVDGELSPESRRALLQALDRSPDGWRRAALAFVEAQVLREAFARLDDEDSRGAGGPPHLKLHPGASGNARASSIPPVRALLAPAAVALLAFTLGWGAREPRVAALFGVDSPSNLASADPNPATNDDELGAGVERLARNGNGGIGAEPVAAHELDPGFALPNDSVILYPTPVSTADFVDERWLRSPEPVVPRELRATWERSGYQIQERKRLLEVPLDDGRQLRVPLGEVRLRYLGLPVH